MYDIVVIGNPAFLLTTDTRQLCGPSVYSATTAARLGMEHLAIIGSLGPAMTDEFAKSLDSLGVPEYYLIKDEAETIQNIHYTNDVGQSIDFLGIPRKIGIRDIPDEFLQSRAILLCPSLQEINEELVEWICNSSDSQVSLNPQLHTVNAEGELELIKELNLLEKTHAFLDVIQPNERESLLITGESDPYLAAELLVEWAAEICIVTMGDRGSIIYDGDDFHIIPPYKTNSIDKIGAGSVYLSGFVSKHLEGKSLSECGAFGSSLASVKVENKGLDFVLNQNDIHQRSEEVLGSVEVR